MPTPIDPKRLPGLKAAMGSFGEEETASQQQLAKLYGCTPSRLSTLIKSRFTGFPPAETRGDKTHWYPARAAVQCMIRYMEDMARGRSAQARRHSAVMGQVQDARAEDQEPLPPTAAELDRLASAQTRVWKLKKDMGLYTLTSDVQQIARGLNSMLTREVMNLVNELDPNGEMTPRQRDQLKDKCRATVLKMREMVGKFLEDEDDAGFDAGASVAGRGASGDNPRRRARTRTADISPAA